MTMGTRGDLEPLVALARGLTVRGHEVWLAGPDNFSDWVESQGLTYFPLGFDMEAFLQSEEVKEALTRSRLALARIWRRDVLPGMRTMLSAVARAGQGADIIVGHPKVMGAEDLAQATGARYVRFNPLPLTPTGEFPPAVWTRDFGPFLNRWFYQLFRLARLPYLKTLNRWRKEELGLGPGPVFSVSGSELESLCAVSPSVIPRPGDWHPRHALTGYWFLEDEKKAWQPEARLENFLDSGEPPVYIGFGSMTSADPHKVTELTLEAVRQSGVRAVVCAGWGGMELPPDDGQVLGIEGAPHAHLFPRCRAVVHHGGAGTTAAGLRAGRPTLVCPFFADQPFWGHRVEMLGCGPAPLSLQGKVSASALAERLHQLVSTTSYAERAAELGQKIRGEDGIIAAIERLESATWPAVR